MLKLVADKYGTLEPSIAKIETQSSGGGHIHIVVVPKVVVYASIGCMGTGATCKVMQVVPVCICLNRMIGEFTGCGLQLRMCCLYGWLSMAARVIVFGFAKQIVQSSPC
jgi:hypothetical protein